MLTRFFTLAFFIPLTATIVSADQISQKAIDNAKAALHQAVESGKIAGGAHLVVKNGKTVHFEAVGFRDIETKKPFGKDTILRIYSMTKPITSVAAMQLYEQGKFKLDDPISKYIPSFEKSSVFVKDGEPPKIVPANRPLSIRDVFRHTTGYGYDGGGNAELDAHYKRERMTYHDPLEMMPPKMTIAEAADALAKIPAMHHPGERFTYGFNTDLLGRLVEVWSGERLDAYLQKNIFAPLQMIDTAFVVPATKQDRFASCHTKNDGKIAIVDKANESPFIRGFQFISGGGGLVSTIQDYANFCQMMVDGGRFQGKRIITEETVDMMFTDQLNGVAGEFQFGLGFAIKKTKLGSDEEHKTVTEYSWGGYASTDFRLIPEEGLFQIVVRQHVPSEHQLAGKLISTVYEGIE